MQCHGDGFCYRELPVSGAPEPLVPATDDQSGAGAPAPVTPEPPSGTRSCQDALAADYCQNLLPLPAAPVIDGVSDCGPGALSQLAPVGWSGPGDAPPPAHRTRYTVAWHPEGLYFFLDIDDPVLIPPPEEVSLWGGDGIELFADADGQYPGAPALDRPGGFHAILAGPPAGGTARRANLSGTGPWQSPRFAAHARPGGYTVEAFVQGEDMGTGPLALAAGGAVGIDILVNVSTDVPRGPGENTRLGQYALRVNGTERPSRSVSAFCNPRLVSAGP
jgi:hypothetical protein